MYIESYFHKHGTVTDNLKCTIPGVDHEEYMNTQYIKLTKEYLSSIHNVGSTALLYAGGPVVHHSSGRVIKDVSVVGNNVIKSQCGFDVHNIAKRLNNIDYVSINGNTCASSIYCFVEAEMLFAKGFDDVIIYAEELTEDTQALLFKQLGIPMVCGDGIAVMHLTREKTTSSIATVVDTSWVWHKSTSPMAVSKEGYSKVLTSLIKTCSVDVVKAHGTDTDLNNSVEDATILELLPETEIVKYKNKIGHTQGASGLLELCMLLEDDETKWSTGICLVAGLGGFYGGIKISR